MNDICLTVFKWASWATIAIVFYIFFLKEIIQFEVIYSNTPGVKLTDGKTVIKKTDLGELEYYRKEALIQSDNAANLVDLLRKKEIEIKEVYAKKVETKEKARNEALLKELNSLRSGIDYLRDRALETIQDIEAFIGGGGKHAHKIDVLKKISDIVTDFKDELTGGSNLLVSDTKLNYKNAQKSCEAIGMFLVTIESKDKLDDVMKTINELKRWDIWIGLNRLGRADETYAWDSGHPVKYTNWDSGQPNLRDPWGKGIEEACTIMWSTGKWHDYSCNVVAHFICESPIHTKNDVIKKKTIKNHVDIAYEDYEDSGDDLL